MFMPNYEKMYSILCSAADDAITLLEEIPNTEVVSGKLNEALLAAEDIYRNCEE